MSAILSAIRKFQFANEDNKERRNAQNGNSSRVPANLIWIK